jgi:hypothetical protein
MDNARKLQINNFKQDDIIPLIVAAQQSKADFMEFIKWYGFGYEHREYKRLDFLIEDDSCVRDWFRFFSGDLDEIIETTDTYKQYKLKKNEMDLHEFLARCSVNLQKACDTLFQESTAKWAVQRLTERLHSDMSLELVYTINKDNPWYNSLSKIVRATW